MYLAVIDYLGAAPLEGRRNLEDGIDEELSLGVDVAPAVLLDGGEALGELVGALVGDGDDDAALDVAIAIAATFLDECQAVVVDIGFGTIAGVVVLDGEHLAAGAVDDAPAVVARDEGAAIDEESGIVELAGDDLAATAVEEAVFAIAEHEDAVFGDAGIVGVDGFGEGAVLGVEEGDTVFIASKEESLEHGGEDFVFDGHDLAVAAVDHAVAVVVLDHGAALVEGVGVLVLWLDDDAALGVDVAVGAGEAVEPDGDDGEAFVEGGGGRVDDGDDDGAEGVVEAVAVALLGEDAPLGGVVDIGVAAGDDFDALAVDEAAGVVVHIDLAVVAVEVVDEHVFVGHDDGAVFAFEAKTLAILGGLDAVDEDQLAAAGFVVDVFDFLDLGPQEGGEGQEEGDEGKFFHCFLWGARGF